MKLFTVTLVVKTPQGAYRESGPVRAKNPITARRLALAAWIARAPQIDIRGVFLFCKPRKEKR